MSNQTAVLQFRAGIRGWEKLTRETARLAQRRVALQIFADVVQQWPVDTGRSRYAWNVSAGTPDLSTPPEGQYPAPVAATVNPRLGEPIYITNAVPYAVALEQGHSRQMPAGSVERALARAVANGGSGDG